MKPLKIIRIDKVVSATDGDNIRVEGRPTNSGCRVRHRPLLTGRDARRTDKRLAAVPPGDDESRALYVSRLALVTAFCVTSFGCSS